MYKASAAPTHVTEFSINAQEDVPTGIAFNSDGTKFFMQGYANDDIHEYTLTTAFEINNTAPTLSSSSPRTTDPPRTSTPSPSAAPSTSLWKAGIACLSFSTGQR